MQSEDQKVIPLAGIISAVPYTPQENVRLFHQAVKYKDYVEEADNYAREHGIKLREKLIGEEYREVIDELIDIRQGDGSIFRLAKELADLLYVVYGTAAYLGIPLPAVFDAVHMSNMSKLDPEGNPIVRWDGKILKGPNYREPDLAKALGFTEVVAETS